jgi:PTH1 family peptidyl-tRNA hydrolase
VRPFGRRAAERISEPVDALLIGLGNPGRRYAGTRHNIGFDVATELTDRWGLGKPAKRFGGLIFEGRIAPGGPRVAVLLPQTFMNESGTAAGPARGSLRLPLERVVAVHDEIDIPFGEIRVKLGGGVAGHKGLGSLDRGFGSRDFWRVRVGVGRPGSSDPETVSRHVLGRFDEGPERVRELIEAAALRSEQLIEGLEERLGE